MLYEKPQLEILDILVHTSAVVESNFHNPEDPSDSSNSGGDW